MHVMEIYRSVQGEGTLTGVPTTFVRFFACNLRCSWCDTKYSWGVRHGGTWQERTPTQVHDDVRALGARHVVLTGGEPVLQKDLGNLAQHLTHSGHHLTVETNTTIFPEDAVAHIQLWSFSPKLASAGSGYLRYPVIEQFLQNVDPARQQWKFVVRDDEDEQCLRQFLERYSVFREQRLAIVLQPESSAAAADYMSTLEALCERVRDPFWDRYNVRVLPQLHVLMWGHRRMV